MEPVNAETSGVAAAPLEPSQMLQQPQIFQVVSAFSAAEEGCLHFRLCLSGLFLLERGSIYCQTADEKTICSGRNARMENNSRLSTALVD